MKYKVYIENPKDRDEIICALARNSYVVRQGREKAKTGSRYLHFVEYWREQTI